MVAHALPLLAIGLAVGGQSTWAGPIPVRSSETEMKVDKRAPPPSFRFGHPYADRTPCWVEGRRGWVKDQRCGDLIDIDASVNVGKRHHSFDHPYFADGTPCFHHGREGIVEDLLCVDLDVDIGEHYPDSDYYGPWQFSHAYNEGRPCWVDYRRGWVQDGACGNLLELDADILLDKRFYKDDPYYVNGVPCVKDGREGVITDYLCVAVDVDVHKRGYWGYHDYRQGLVNNAPCWDNGREGLVDGLLCVVADVSVGKRSLVGPPDGEACTRDGRWGHFKDAICIDADVDISARGLLVGNNLIGGLVGGITGGNRYRPQNGRPAANPYSHYREDEPIDIDTLVDVKRALKHGDLKSTIKSETDVDAKVHHDVDAHVKSDTKVHARAHDLADVDLKSYTVGTGKIHHNRRIFDGQPTKLDLDSKTEAETGVKLHRKSLRYNDKTAVNFKADVDAEADIKARHVTDPDVGHSVKDLGKVANDAVGHGKRDLLGLTDLLDLDSTLDVVGGGHGRYTKNKPGLLGGVIRRAPVAQPALLNGLGLGGKPGPAGRKGKSDGLLSLGKLLGGKPL